MRFYMKLLVLLIGFTLFSPLAALAQQNCGKTAEIKTALENQYKEKVVVIGTTNQNQLLTIFSSKNGDTWTLVMTFTNGKSCLMSAGENLRIIDISIEDLI